MIHSARTKRLLIASLIAVPVAAAIIALIFTQPMLILKAEYMLHDHFLEERAEGEPSPEVVLVDIDERSLAELGTWTWPRFITARIFDHLADAGVRAICADYIPAERDTTSPVVWADRISRGFGISVDISAIGADIPDFDEVFAKALARSRAIIGALLTNDPDDRGKAFVRTLPIREIREQGARTLIEYLEELPGIISPLPVLAEAVPYCGLMNQLPDDDGNFRTVPAFLAHDGRPIASLALTSLATYLGADEIVVRVARSGPLSLSVGGIDVPVMHDGYIMPMFRAYGTQFRRYSAADIYAGRFDPAELKGCIVVFGASAEGLSDLRPTPIDPMFTSLQLNAAVIDAILSDRMITFPHQLFEQAAIGVVLLSIISVALFSLAHPAVALFVAGGLATAVWSLCSSAMTTHGVIATPIFALATLIVQPAQTFGVRYFFEKRERALLRKSFGTFVAPEVVDRIVTEGGVDRMRGETREITALFTDIRGFTSTTERMRPDDVAELLDAYFTPMTRIVRESGGTLDKFIGDSLMAFWNAPLDVPDHQLAAAASMMEMRRSLVILNEQLERDFGTRFDIGGGLHTGPAHVGNMGTRELISYTALGDTVNTASRLEAMCPRYGVGMVMSAETAAPCAEVYRTVPLDVIRVKGRQTPLAIFTALERDEAERRESELSTWDEAFALYRAGEFADCARLCAELQAQRPDVALYGIFADRATHLASDRPAEWDGVLTFTSK